MFLLSSKLDSHPGELKFFTQGISFFPSFKLVFYPNLWPVECWQAFPRVECNVLFRVFVKVILHLSSELFYHFMSSLTYLLMCKWTMAKIERETSFSVKTSTESQTKNGCTTS